MKTLLLFALLLSGRAFADASSWPEKSLFQLSQTWVEQNEKKVELKDLAGHPTLITMTFTSCPGACPLMVNDMKAFERQLNKSEKKLIRFATFSIDPEHDTPAALTKFYKKMHLDSRWTLLTSNADQVREMAALLGFSYKDLGDGDFTHSTSLYLLSSKGEILARKERSGDWKEFLDKVRADLKDAKK